MTSITPEPPEPTRNRALPLVAILLFLAPLASHAYAQSAPPTKLADINSADEKPTGYKTFYLSNVITPHDSNDIVTDLRNMLPNSRMFFVPSQSALSVRGSADDIALAQKILADLDRPRKAYRLTYTITETGSSQPGGQHVTLIASSGGETDFKQGSKIPLVTGTYPQESQFPHTEVQYQDIGLEIEATLNGYADGVHLRSKIEQSNVSDEKSGIGTQDPIFRQTMLDSTTPLVPGKPLILGSLDIPGTNRHQQVEVTAEAIP